MRWPVPVPLLCWRWTEKRNRYLTVDSRPSGLSVSLIKTTRYREAVAKNTPCRKSPALRSATIQPTSNNPIQPEKNGPIVSQGKYARSLTRTPLSHKTLSGTWHPARDFHHRLRCRSRLVATKHPARWVRSPFYSLIFSIGQINRFASSTRPNRIGLPIASFPSAFEERFQPGKH